MMLMPLTLAILAAQVTPIDLEWPDAKPLLFAADGPGYRRVRGALGGRLFLFTGGDLLPVPTLAADVAWGASVDTDLVLHISTIGVLSMAEGGARIRLGQIGGARFAALAELAGILAIGRGSDDRFQVAAAGGLIPGLMVSLGSPADVVWTLGLDLPLILGRGGPRMETLDRTVVLRPSATVESPGGFYGRLEAYLPSDLANNALAVAVGYAW